MNFFIWREIKKKKKLKYGILFISNEELPKKIHILKVTITETNMLKCCPNSLICFAKFSREHVLLQLLLEQTTLLTRVNSSIIETNFTLGVSHLFLFQARFRQKVCLSFVVVKLNIARAKLNFA